MFALIFDGKVTQIEAKQFDVAPTFIWVDITSVTPTPDVEWSWDGSDFAPPPPAPLSDLKRDKKAEFKREGVARISAVIPEWDDFDRIALLASVWNMFGNPANAAQTLAKDIYLYVKGTALPKLAALTTQTELDAVDPAAVDPFGDGSLWPT